MAKLRIGVLASGRGSNLQAIINAVNDNTIEAEISVVITDNKEAHARERAGHAGIPNYHIDFYNYSCKLEFEQQILALLKEHQVDLVCLAGYMRILSKTVLEAYRNRIINIHPSLLPAFPGLNAQKQALDYGVRFSGCTIHFVEEEVDAGPIILQAVVPVLQDDTVESLADRILKEEHRIYVQALTLYQQQRLRVKNRKVTILQ